MKVETFLFKKLDRKQNHLIKIYYNDGDSLTYHHHKFIEFYLKGQLKNIFKRKISCISIDYDCVLSYKPSDENKEILIKIITKDIIKIITKDNK